MKNNRSLRTDGSPLRTAALHSKTSSRKINRWWKGNLAAKAPNKVPLVLPAIIQGKMIWIKDQAFEMEQGGWRSAGYGANEIQLVAERLDRRLAEYFGS